MAKHGVALKVWPSIFWPVVCSVCSMFKAVYTHFHLQPLTCTVLYRLPRINKSGILKLICLLLPHQYLQQNEKVLFLINGSPKYSYTVREWYTCRRITLLLLLCDFAKCPIVADCPLVQGVRKTHFFRCKMSVLQNGRCKMVNFYQLF